MNLVKLASTSFCTLGFATLIQAQDSFYFSGKPTAETLNPTSIFVGARCTEDQLVENEQAIARQDWAHRCGWVDKIKWGQRYKYYPDPISYQPIPRAKEAYPIFARNDPATNFPVVIIDSNGPCDQIPKDGSVVFFTVCEAGCYAPNQKISLSDKDVEIGKMSFDRNHRLMTLANDANLENIRFTSVPLSRFIASVKSAQEELYIFNMASGGSLTVTPNHPIVSKDGTIKKASEFKKGEFFIRKDSLFDEIKNIDVKNAFTKVFNVAPKSLDAHENIVVAQGYLNGSQNYQDEVIKDLSFLARRESVASDLLD